MLKKYHYIESDRAEDGLIAIKMIQERLSKKCCNKMYSLIFMDIQMPGLDGFQTTTKILKLLKKQKKTPCSIVALTSNYGEGTKESAKKVGMKEVVNKPINSENLNRVLYKYYYN